MKTRALAAFLVLGAACSRAPAPSARIGSGAATPRASSPPVTPLVPVRFAAVGDIGRGNKAEARVAQLIAGIHREHPLDALLLLGDLIYPDGSGARYEMNFAIPYAPVLQAGIRLAPVLGNVDLRTEDGEEVIERFHMTGPYYSLTIGPVALFALDSNRVGPKQLEWLTRGLSTTRAPWRVLFMHHPPHSAHGKEPDIARALDPIVRRFHVQLVLGGHYHDYERTYPLNGTVYVVNGTGCCLGPEPNQSSRTATVARANVVVVGEASADRLVLTAVDVDGREIDRTDMTLSARGTLLCPGPPSRSSPSLDECPRSGTGP